MELFVRDDFKIFAITEFHERMAAIAARIRPKLASAGAALAPRLSEFVDAPLYPHVAKHARRTVNPPDDTWVAFSVNPRGYKKSVHFKLAVSRNAVRLLCEVGPEYPEKARWLSAWNHESGGIARAFRRGPGLAWFENEHNEEAEGPLAPMTVSALQKLPESLTRRRDGHFVLGRRVGAAEYLKLRPSAFEKLALETYKPLAEFFRVT